MECTGVFCSPSHLPCVKRHGDANAIDMAEGNSMASCRWARLQSFGGGHETGDDRSDLALAANHHREADWDSSPHFDPHIRGL